jgi:hypothetical protein
MNKSIYDWISKHQPNLVIISQYNRKDLPRREMEAAIAGIKTLVSHVLIIGNTPVFGDYRYMSSPALFQSEYIAPKKMSILKMDRTNEEVSDSFLTGLTRKGIETIDLNYLWCDSQYCNRFGSEDWLFFDVSHLSAVGAAKAVPYFTNFLNNH